MIAAVYARKSTEQNDIGEEAKSVTRQIEHAKAFAASKGWAVPDEFVFVDDGISGALFGAKRPGLARLLNALTARPPFQTVIASEESRFGREQIETAYVLKTILDAGLRVWFYLEGRERTLDTAMDKVMLSLTNFASEMEREKAAQRVFDAQLRKARGGFVTGGGTYGYRNVPVTADALGRDGKPLRLHVRYELDEAEAAVVRRIFGLYATGRGSTAIAAMLNREAVPGPRGNGWGQSAIRDILRRETYIGRLTWGRLQTTVRKGRVKFVQRPAEQWIRTEDESLRIIGQPLWDAVQVRRAKNHQAFARQQDGRLLGRPTWADGFSEYLWPGLAACVVCGGSIRTLTVKHGPAPNRRTERFYACSRNQQGGDGACANSIRIPHDSLDGATLEKITTILVGPLIEEAVTRAITRLREAQGPALERLAAVDRERATLEGRIQRAVDALLDGDRGLPEVRERLGEYRARLGALEAERRHLERASAFARVDDVEVAQEARDAARDMLALLNGHVAQARQAVKVLLGGRPLTVTPFVEGRRRGFHFEGHLVLDGLIIKGSACNGSGVSSCASSATSAWRRHPRRPDAGAPPTSP